MNCPACASDVGDTDPSCPSCGARIDAPGQHPTRTWMAPTPPGGPSGGAAQRSRASRSLASDPSDHGRFVPGSMLLGRYRILGLLGRGGMGEVYRADDLTLGQHVALKFLPPELAEDADRLARFRGEVRLARAVSHPSVCRVYDIGEADGQVFLSMEYIDGEDLSTLLRRIGRLPRDKALEIARQLCAGLAAAHDRGVVHRDLKPANVMIDGQGRARITDFGLASIAGTGDVSDRSGTPAYMAPEQLAGAEATVKSDIYALGLVLYELFTGKRPFRGDTLADVTRSRVDTTPPPPSTLIEGLDPAVERVILRCLERDPAGRPASALKVAAALPGGDPLAMALAAGETPSPDMVAASGEAGALSPSAVRFWIFGLLIGAIAMSWAVDQTTLLGRIETPKSTEVLLERARQIARLAGYTEPPKGVVYGYGWHRTYLEHLEATDHSAGRWSALARPQPNSLYLWYRQSPRPLQALGVAGIATDEDPPPLVPGMLLLTITSSGDLWEFNAVPPQVVDSDDPPAAPADWASLFHEAGLKIEDFTPITPRWVPTAFGDTRVAWEGSYAGAPDLRVRVEAASFRGRPISFRVYWPWNRPLRAQPFQASQGQEIAGGIILVLLVGSLIGGALLARANARMGRVDWKGALRLALVVVAASLLGGLFAATHVLAPGGEWDLLTRLFGRALFDGLYVWVIYVALEPLVRRRWPEGMVSWTRLLAGRLQDPMVGRDLLIGIGVGLAVMLVQGLLIVIPSRLGWPTHLNAIDFDTLAGPAKWMASAMGVLIGVVSQSLILMFALSLMRLILRRDWAATAAFFLLCFTILTLTTWPILDALALVFGALAGALISWSAVRFGLLAMTSAIFTVVLFQSFPVAAWPGAWYAAPGLFVFLLLAVLVAFAARAALAGRSLLDMRVLNE